MQILSLLAQAPMYLALMDTKGVHLWVNVVGFGVQPEEVIGRNTIERVVEEDKAYWRECLRRVVDNRKIVSGNVRANIPSGITQFAFRLSPVLDDGVVTGIWCACWIDEDNCMRFMLSPLSEAVVCHLLAHGNQPQKGSAIGHAVGESTTNQASQKLRVTLGSLTERHILTHSPSGYTISEEFLPFCRPLSPKCAAKFMEHSRDV